MIAHLCSVSFDSSLSLVQVKVREKAVIEEIHESDHEEMLLEN